MHYYDLELWFLFPFGLFVCKYLREVRLYRHTYVALKNSLRYIQLSMLDVDSLNYIISDNPINLIENICEVRWYTVEIRIL